MSELSRFDWDDGNLEKCQRHGVSIAEIESLFLGDARVAPDIAHSGVEQRFIAVGRTSEGRALFVAFTLREVGGFQLVRPVSARFMHRKEGDRYG